MVSSPFPHDTKQHEEPLGLYCSKGRAVIEKGIYMDTELHEVQNEITVDLKIRKFKETIEEVEKAAEYLII